LCGRGIVEIGEGGGMTMKKLRAGRVTRAGKTGNAGSKKEADGEKQLQNGFCDFGAEPPFTWKNIALTL
jgi:hypothetical protein